MSFQGMSNATGRTLTDRDHIAQSVRDILTTPIGTRIMRRDYGSLLPELIDQPQHQTTRLRAMSATVSALLRWEPRIRIMRVSMETTADGQLFIDIEHQRVDGPRAGLQQLRVPLGTKSV